MEPGAPTRQSGHAPAHEQENRAQKDHDATNGEARHPRERPGPGRHSTDLSKHHCVTKRTQPTRSRRDSAILDTYAPPVYHQTNGILAIEVKLELVR